VESNLLNLYITFCTLDTPVELCNAWVFLSQRAPWLREKVRIILVLFVPGYLQITQYNINAVLNKYFPPDFDPSKIPRGKKLRTEEKQMKVRMMLPMSVRCNTCGNFMYKGTKFNTRMENVKGEDYLGIRLYRFYYKCTNCSAEFCMKTDPQTTDYIVEAGATRNYEPWKDREQKVNEALAKRHAEEKGDAMKALENKTLDSKREMDIMTALDEVKTMKSRHENLGHEAALAALRQSAKEQGKTLEEEMDEEDERQVQMMLLQQSGLVRRLSESDDSDIQGENDNEKEHFISGTASNAIHSIRDEDMPAMQRKNTGQASVKSSHAALAQKRAIEEPKTVPSFGGKSLLKNKRVKPIPAKTVDKEPASLIGLVGDYGSSESE
jgi:hypothetical protein